MKRKQFILKTILGAGSIINAPVLGFAKKSPSLIDPLPSEKVREFVIAGHTDLDKVKNMLGEMPGLLFATWDWGGGDFETALEGAGHMGNKEIANVLISKGARTNLFALTMLGKTELVKGYLEIYPEYLTAKGPHGLTLLHHANKGGEQAKELSYYLQSKGLTETFMKL